MANNFKILRHRTDGNLQLSLAGDFDGSSTFELLNTLETNLHSNDCVSINTSSLNKIHPFGRQVFKQHFSKLKHHQTCVKFIGKNADQIMSP
jgi:hypothetical protein